MNYVSLLGRLTKDPELKQSSSGKSYCRFSIAVKREFVKDGVDFINCIAWDKRAEFISNYFSKGKRILIQGRLNINSYESNGEKRISTDVIVDKADFIEGQSNQSSQIEKSNFGSDNENTIEEDFDEDEEFPF